MNSNKTKSQTNQPVSAFWFGKSRLVKIPINKRADKVPRHSRRRGSMLVEVTISAGLVATLLIIISQLVVQLQRQTKLVDRHILAQQTLENLLEDAVRAPWSSLTSEMLAKLELPETALAGIPLAELSGEVFEEQNPVQAKQVTLRLSWQRVAGIPSRPLILTTWVYKQQEVKP